jgi:hypothetical protein
MKLLAALVAGCGRGGGELKRNSCRAMLEKGSLRCQSVFRTKARKERRAIALKGGRMQPPKKRDETTISTFFTCSPEAYNSAASFEVALPTADAFKSLAL